MKNKAESLLIEQLFIEQLVYMLASDGPITISKKGRVFVIEGKNNKATFPSTVVPQLADAYKHYKNMK